MGKFLSSDSNQAHTQEHVRFERLDVHRIQTPPRPGVAGIDQLAITPKLSDDTLLESAIVLCTRSVDKDGPLSDYQCNGL